MNTTNNLWRRLLLMVALVGTLAAAGWVASQDQIGKEPEPRDALERKAARRDIPASKAQAEPTAELPLELLKRANDDAEVVNMFPSRNWLPPPPKVSAKPAPPPPPQAPPLPFTAFGQMIEDGNITVFLNGKDRSYAVKVGDVVNKAYRVDTIRDGVVVLTYLPLNQQQTLRTGTN